jgi:hypothetical protein
VPAVAFDRRSGGVIHADAGERADPAMRQGSLPAESIAAGRVARRTPDRSWKNSRLPSRF